MFSSNFPTFCTISRGFLRSQNVSPNIWKHILFLSYVLLKKMSGRFDYLPAKPVCFFSRFVPVELQQFAKFYSNKILFFYFKRKQWTRNTFYNIYDLLKDGFSPSTLSLYFPAFWNWDKIFQILQIFGINGHMLLLTFCSTNSTITYFFILVIKVRF